MFYKLFKVPTIEERINIKKKLCRTFKQHLFDGEKKHLKEPLNHCSKNFLKKNVIIFNVLNEVLRQHYA